jgi:tetratricopeptide (TPR) repeat protein
MFTKAFEAFQNKNYATAGKLWIDNIGQSTSDKDLEKILNTCKKAESDGIQNEWVFATIAAVYLEAGDYFFEREETLLEAITYANKAIALQPAMHQAQRYAGSACYWLGDYTNAKKYYEQSIKILPDVLLLHRIIECTIKLGEPLPDTKITLDFDGTSAKYYYEQGVGATELSQKNIPNINKDQIIALARNCYERCYDLYSVQLTPLVANAEGEIHPDNHQHNLAMCCHNLALIYNDLKMHHEALRVLNVGKQFSSFEYLWSNIRNTYQFLNNLEEEVNASVFLLENFEVSDETYFYSMYRICHYNLINNEYQDALDTANEAIEEFQELSPQSQANTAILNVYAEMYNSKIAAEKALGIFKESEVDESPINAALMETPNDVDLIIKRGMLFMQQSEFDKALNCYNQAIQFGTDNKDDGNVSNALLKRGYLNLYYLQKTTDALLDFNKIEKMGFAEFYTYYYQMNCHYINKMLPQIMVAYNKAAKCITAVEENDKGAMSQLYMMLGDTSFDLNKFEEAVVAYEKSLSYEYIEGVANNLEAAKTEVENLKTIPKTEGGGFFKKLFG